ncbi:hypothetical protein BJY01DRAFT_259367 [Aspergillus pseudoustus]|uniref:chitinase n=1 Tax=Aspergillus pseudoustus TaxID=1810923 RepID=A0ABR4J462_9EURO
MFSSITLHVGLAFLLLSPVSAFDPSITNAIDAYLADHPIATRSASATASQNSPVGTKQGTVDAVPDWTPPISNLSRRRCPSVCTSTGLDSHGWPVYHSVDRLSWCDQPMLLDFALFNPLADEKTHVAIAACVADLSTASGAGAGDNNGTTTTSDLLCLPETNLNNTEKVTAQLQLVSSSRGQSGSTSNDNVVEALSELQALSALRPSGCNETTQFALAGEAAVGVYVGSALSAQGVLPSILETLVEHVQNEGFSDTLLVQLCDANGRSSRYGLGVIAVTGSGHLAAAQAAVQTWRNGSCVAAASDQTAQTWQSIAFSVPTPPESSSASKSTSAAAVQIVSGGTCTTIAEECGVTLAEFEGYNDEELCDTPLQPDQYVCCSAGTLPDYSPQPDEDDNCYVYLVQTGDDCSTVAAAYDLTLDEIENYNNNTWAWMGCDDLLANMNICLSSGWPPTPTEIENAVCGTQVPDTPVASHATNLSTLNECHLNACYDIWGQCGTTAEFCTISKSPTGAPGTAAVGANGCISNCGTEIVIDGSPPQIYSIAYFEGFSWSRPCLTMSISEVNTTSYTHIHFAFATINTDYTLNITAIEGQLPFFAALTGAVTSANRGTLIQSVVDVLEAYDLDGVDWDWEYPDEPDIPGIPAGTEAEVSLTAPASFWYLQAFTVKAMSAVVDYIVYMTYDLHGQWDYNNSYTDPGCPAGNCLRSHVNLTETINSLSMITKTGVSNTQLVVGVASYGRSFKMTTAGCWTEMCTYTGPDSGARAGECTETAGYLANAEMESILADNPSAQVYWDSDAFSDVLVYNETEWVSFMNASNKAVRILLYEVYGFLGYADWAVDLQGEGGSSSGSSSSSSSSSSSGASLSTGYIAPFIWSEATPVIAVWNVILPTETTDGIIYLTSSIQPPPFTITLTPVWEGTTSIEAPTTTTENATIVVWSSTTWSFSAVTETVGSNTVITGGITGTPVPIIITPHQQPTTVSGDDDDDDDDVDKDTNLNTRTTSWTSGSPISPPCVTGDKCGVACVDWCNPNCPSCPPGLMGSSGGRQ